MATTLKDEIRSKIENVKSQSSPESEVSISSADVAEFSKDKSEKKERVSGDVKTPVSEAYGKDKMMATASDRTWSDVLEEPGDAPPETVVVDDEDRRQFLEALVSGKRYQRSFSLFGGKITGVFRSRSQLESRAISVRLYHENRNGEIAGAPDFTVRMRAMMLAAQVEELDGTGYVELAKPYMRTVVGKDVTEPGWLDQARHFAEMNEALAEAVFNELKSFEKKYWTMVDRASDQNFWNPEKST